MRHQKPAMQDLLDGWLIEARCPINKCAGPIRQTPTTVIEREGFIVAQSRCLHCYTEVQLKVWLAGPNIRRQIITPTGTEAGDLFSLAELRELKIQEAS